jgi:hypothetical protein
LSTSSAAKTAHSEAKGAPIPSSCSKRAFCTYSRWLERVSRQG